MREPDEPLRLVGEQVVVRTIETADLPALEAVMDSPGVKFWWWDFDIAELTTESRDPDTHAFVIERAGEVVGYIQFSEEASLQYRFAGIDISLHDDAQGRGLGRDAVRTLARYLIEERGHHRLTIDPALANTRAIHCYERVGFRRVGVLREYEKGADGTWHDGLLMEMLAGELR
jgi:aminoglycoside 6'-N-acetyltransferase